MLRGTKKMTTKQNSQSRLATLKKPIPLTLEQYECQTCKKKFYINIEDVIEGKKLFCPFCEDNDVQNVREFYVSIEAIGIVN